MEYNAQQEAVLSTLGREDGTAGKAIVDLVTGLANNHREILEAVNSHNENVARFEQTLAQKADQADVDDINRRLAAAAQMLSGAVVAHDTAAQAANGNASNADTMATARAARSATRVASQSVADCDRRIDTLEDRMDDFELWRRETVDPALTRFNAFIENTERRTPQVPLIQHPQPPVREATVEERVEPQPVVHPPTQVQPTVERRFSEREEVRVRFRDQIVNMRQWQGPQWFWAIVLGLVFMYLLGPVFADWARSTMEPRHAWEWFITLIQVVMWIAATALGFTLGGMIGTAYINARTRQHAIQREEHVHHARHADEHEVVREDEATHVR